jgi:hypothetical protein
VHVTVKLTEKGRAAAAPSVGGEQDAESPDVAALASASGSRSDAFLTIWKAANLGPFMTVRVAVYDEIDKSLANGATTTLKALVSDAVKTVRKAGIEESPKFPWSRVTQFVESLMRRRPVALSGGNPVSLSWTNGSIEVTEMIEDWQLMLDGELVLYLVDLGVELRIHDMSDLAGALYAGRTEDDINRAYEVVRRLIKDGLIAEGSPDEPLRRVPATPLRAPDAAPTARDLRLASETDAQNA